MARICPVASHGHRGLIVRILIADDNPVFQSVLRVMLTNWDYSVVGASFPSQAPTTL